MECAKHKTRIYVPDKCVFGFRNKKEVDIFSEETEALEEAKKIIKGKNLM